MNTAKARARHDLTCPPSCPHFGDLFKVSFPRDTWFDRLEREVSEMRPTEPFILQEYRVQIEDEAGFVFSVLVRASGPHDAANQAKVDYPDCWVRKAPRA